ncbi:MAG: IS66 family transposase [Actinomycetota bacterium]|nr:IS66 family transposase [Actinomycetota bacterium]
MDVAEPDWEEVAGTLSQENERLRSENAELHKTIAALEKKIADLEARLGRNPRNSSMPPSAEGLSKPPAPNRAERRKAKRRPGKQPGDPGHHLAQVADPDEVVPHRPARCPACEGDLADAKVLDVERRQVFEVPRIRAHVTEHQMLKVRCSCGCETKAPPPPEATAPACYGPGIRALAVYLSVYQHVPYDRLAEIFADVLSIPVSVGAIKAMVAEAGGGLGLFLEVVAGLLKDVPAVHFDETGARVEGSLHWVHVACTSLYTLLFCHKRRGTLALDDGGIIANMAGVAIHDGYASYRTYNVVHGLCGAHHLRELQGVIDRFDQEWADQMIDLLLEAKETVEKAVARGAKRLDRTALHSIRVRYGTLIQKGWAENAHPTKTADGKWYEAKALNLLERLDAYRDDVLRFATDFNVGFDNNQAERDIRMVKLQQKISGSWRTKTGADHFCAIRSYVSTMKKHGHGVLDGLRSLFMGDVWLPEMVPRT